MLGPIAAMLLILLCAFVVYACLCAGSDYGEQSYERPFVDVNEAGEVIDFDAEAKLIRDAMQEEHW